MKSALGSLGLILILSMIFISCNKKDSKNGDYYLDGPVCTGSFIPKSYDRQVVGFYPGWDKESLPVSEIQWDKLTRIVCAFAIPNADGTMSTSYLELTHELVDSAHAHGVEVYFSIGGGDGSTHFPAMATNEVSRNRFIKEVKQYLFENCLDGVDIDWEYWSGYANDAVIPAESNAFVTLMKMLKAELSPFHLGISIDVGATDWSGKYFFDEVPTYTDYVMVMGYDFSGTWSAPGPHSAFADAIGYGNTSSSTGLAYWVNYRGWPKEKILLGVPFYGKNFDSDGGAYISYVSILMLYPDAYLHDQEGNIYYDGISTMKAKTQYVADNNFAGIMIWELTLDSKVDSLSLLNAINTVLHP
jgi:chitinase